MRRTNPRGDDALTLIVTLSVVGLVGAIGYELVKAAKDNSSGGVPGNSIPGNPDWGVVNGVPGNYPPVGTPGDPMSYRN